MTAPEARTPEQWAAWVADLQRQLAEVRRPVAGNPSNPDTETLRQTLEEYKDSERLHEREQAIFHSGPVVIFTWGMGRGYPVLYVTPNITQFGYCPDDFLAGRVNMKQIIHADDLPRINELVKTSRERHETYTQTDYRIICANGDIRWVYDFTRLIYDDARYPCSYGGVVYDDLVEGLWRLGLDGLADDGRLLYAADPQNVVVIGAADNIYTIDLGAVR